MATASSSETAELSGTFALSILPHAYACLCMWQVQYVDVASFHGIWSQSLMMACCGTYVVHASTAVAKTACR
jgi:hypothetical protein